jgi:hypothetical protein
LKKEPSGAWQRLRKFRSHSLDPQTITNYPKIAIMPGAVGTDPYAARKRFFLKKKQKLLLIGARGAAALLL